MSPEFRTVIIEVGSACQQIAAGQMAVCKNMSRELPDLSEGTRDQLETLIKNNLELHKIIGESVKAALIEYRK
jgi:hypothetical protein